jgi:DHA2 family multidrug resistance protein-like MFS transporter
MDLTVLFLAVPSLSAALSPSSTQLLWISDIYGFMVAGWLITMGTLGDRIGRRRLLLIGAAVFGATSVVAAFAPTAEALIASRAVLGLAGATVAPSTLSLIRNMFVDPEERTFAIGIWVTAFSVGGVLGPLVGGVLLEYFWWGSVFLMAVPIMVLVLVLGPRLLPEFRDPDAGRLDLTSAALSLGAVLGVIYGIKRMAVDGPVAAAILAIAAGAALGVVFVRRQARLADPLIDLRLFRDRAFSVALATYLLGVFVLFGLSLLTAQYFQSVLGLSPMEAGLWTLPSASGFVVGSLAAPRLLRRFRPATLMAAGMLLSAAGFLPLLLVRGDSGLFLVVGGMTLMALSMAPVVTLATDLIVGAAPPERAGAAGAISETSAEFGGALSIAIIGSIATAVYRGGMVGAAAVVPPAVLDAARSTVAAAVDVARALPADQAALLLATAFESFAGAIRLVAMIGIGICLATAAMIVGVLRRA